MAVPDFQTLMRPLLEEYAAGGERPSPTCALRWRRSSGSREEELAERLPSGLAKTFDNRVGWAATYLYRVGLLAQAAALGVRDHRARSGGAGGEPRTGRPQRALAVPRVRASSERRAARESGRRSIATPTRRRSGHSDARGAHRGRVPGAARGADRRGSGQDRRHAPQPAFEDLVLDVLHAMGYGDGTEHSRLRTGGSGDAGIDGVIREDRLGLDVVYVQAKRWEATVGRPVVQGFVGALQGARASKGIIFTASSFSADAQTLRGRRVATGDPDRRRAPRGADDRPQRRRERPRDIRREARGQRLLRRRGIERGSASQVADVPDPYREKAIEVDEEIERRRRDRRSEGEP